MTAQNTSFEKKVSPEPGGCDRRCMQRTKTPS